jgi:hypothetical protein
MWWNQKLQNSMRLAPNGCVQPLTAQGKYPGSLSFELENYDEKQEDSFARATGNCSYRQGCHRNLAAGVPFVIQKTNSTTGD